MLGRLTVEKVGRRGGRNKNVVSKGETIRYERIYTCGRMEIRLNAFETLSEARSIILSLSERALSRAFHGIRICRIGQYPSTCSFV